MICRGWTEMRRRTTWNLRLKTPRAGEALRKNLGAACHRCISKWLDRSADPAIAKATRSNAESEIPQFFILDSTTGAIERGLSREDWLKKLQKAGVQGEPEPVPSEKKGP